MFIIYIAHVPWNWWTLWIPARFGFSDATEMFVFCSGMASALAFGKIFDLHGLGIGAARILHRMWQVYWAHIGQLLVIAVGLVMVHESGYLQSCCDLTQDYVVSLNLWHLFNNTAVALPGIMTLTWVPNYFDILPMYIVILALIPVIMLASRISVKAAFAVSISLWLASQFDLLSLPAEPWSDREWFFNPFAWQLLFFTGFAFMRGWIPAPPVNAKLLILCTMIVLATVPFAYFRVYGEAHLNWVWAREVREFIKPLWIKTEFGVLRYIHFLALAYLAWAAAGEHGKYLLGPRQAVGRICADCTEGRPAVSCGLHGKPRCGASSCDPARHGLGPGRMDPADPLQSPRICGPHRRCLCGVLVQERALAQASGKGDTPAGVHAPAK
jgi:hypothetical protein